MYYSISMSLMQINLANISRSKVMPSTSKTVLNKYISVCTTCCVLGRQFEICILKHNQLCLYFNLFYSFKIWKLENLVAVTSLYVHTKLCSCNFLIKLIVIRKLSVMTTFTVAQHFTQRQIYNLSTLNICKALFCFALGIYTRYSLQKYPNRFNALSIFS